MRERDREIEVGGRIVGPEPERVVVVWDRLREAPACGEREAQVAVRLVHRGNAAIAVSNSRAASSKRRRSYSSSPRRLCATWFPVVTAIACSKSAVPFRQTSAEDADEWH